MTKERLNAAIITQRGYYHTGAVRRSLGTDSGLTLSLENISRKFSFGAIPHYGAHLLAAYCQAADLNPTIFDLKDPGVIRKTSEYPLVLLSAMDIGLDTAERILQGLSLKNIHIIAGGYGITANAERLIGQYPGVTFIPGHAEEVLGLALDELRTKGQMNHVYQRDNNFDLTNFGREPFMNEKIWQEIRGLFGIAPLKATETSRGCSEGCYYCPTAGEKPNHKPVNVLIEEINRMNIKPWETLFFVDQNLLVHSDDYLRVLFDYLNQHSIHWIGEGIRPEMAEGSWDDSLFQKIAKNCLVFYIGIEEIGNRIPGSKIKSKLAEGDNLDRLVLGMRKLGLPVLYSMIFGTDNQYPGYGRHAAERIKRLKMNVSSHILTPRPGTPLWNKMDNHGRLEPLANRSSNRDFGNINFKPGNMTIREAWTEYLAFMHEVFAPEEIKQRLVSNSRELGMLKALILLGTDTAYVGSMLSVDKQYPDIAKKVMELSPLGRDLRKS